VKRGRSRCSPARFGFGRTEVAVGGHASAQYRGTYADVREQHVGFAGILDPVGLREHGGVLVIFVLAQRNNASNRSRGGRNTSSGKADVDGRRCAWGHYRSTRAPVDEDFVTRTPDTLRNMAAGRERRADGAIAVNGVAAHSEVFVGGKKPTAPQEAAAWPVRVFLADDSGTLLKAEAEGLDSKPSTLFEVTRLTIGAAANAKCGQKLLATGSIAVKAGNSVSISHKFVANVSGIVFPRGQSGSQSLDSSSDSRTLSFTTEVTFEHSVKGEMVPEASPTGSDGNRGPLLRSKPVLLQVTCTQE
jgi:hypothetical protein